jgi:hypothetical protein
MFLHLTETLIRSTIEELLTEGVLDNLIEELSKIEIAIQVTFNLEVRGILSYIPNVILLQGSKRLPEI